MSCVSQCHHEKAEKQGYRSMVSLEKGKTVAIFVFGTNFKKKTNTTLNKGTPKGGGSWLPSYFCLFSLLPYKYFSLPRAPSYLFSCSLLIFLFSLRPPPPKICICSLIRDPSQQTILGLWQVKIRGPLCDFSIVGCQWIVNCLLGSLIIIDREAREIMHLVASVRLSVRPFVCLCVLSCLNKNEKNREESLSVRGICLCVDYLAQMRSIGF